MTLTLASVHSQLVSFVGFMIYLGTLALALHAVDLVYVALGGR